MREQERLDSMTGRRRRKENSVNTAFRGPTFSRAFFYAERRRRLRASNELERFFESVRVFYGLVSVPDPTALKMINNLMHGADVTAKRAAAIAIGADTVSLFNRELTLARHYLESTKLLIAMHREHVG